MSKIKNNMIIILKNDGSTQIFFKSSIAEYDKEGNIQLYVGNEQDKNIIPDKILISRK